MIDHGQENEFCLLEQLSTVCQIALDRPSLDVGEPWTAAADQHELRSTLSAHLRSYCESGVVVGGIAVSDTDNDAFPNRVAA